MSAFATVKIEGEMGAAGLCDSDQWMCVMVQALKEERGHMIGVDTGEYRRGLVMVKGDALAPDRYYRVRRDKGRVGDGKGAVVDDRVVQLTKEEAQAWARDRGPAAQVAVAAGLAPYATSYLGKRMYVNRTAAGHIITGWLYTQESGWDVFAVGDGVTQEMRDEMGTPDGALSVGAITQEQCTALNAHRVAVLESWASSLKAQGQVWAEVYSGAETVRVR